jgi:hypothetical protein
MFLVRDIKEYHSKMKFSKKKKSNKTYKTSSSGVNTSKKIVLICYICCKPGYYQNKYKEKKINSLVIDESLKKTLFAILINESEGEDLNLRII